MLLFLHSDEQDGDYTVYIVDASRVPFALPFRRRSHGLVLLRGTTACSYRSIGDAVEQLSAAGIVRAPLDPHAPAPTQAPAATAELGSVVARCLNGEMSPKDAALALAAALLAGLSRSHHRTPRTNHAPTHAVLPQQAGGAGPAMELLVAHPRAADFLAAVGPAIGLAP